MLWLVVVAICCFLLYKYVINPVQYWEKFSIPYVKGWPVVGSHPEAFFRRKSFIDLTMEHYRRFPNERYFGSNQIGKQALNIRDLELIKQITIKDFDHFTDHTTIFPEGRDPLLEKNLLTLKGQKWHDMRTTLSPAFTSSKMRTMFVLMSDCAKDVANYLIKESNGKVLEIEMKDLITKYTNDVIATSSFGIKCDSLNEPNNVFRSMGKKVIEFNNFFAILKLMLITKAPKIAQILKLTVLPKDATTYFKKIVLETIDTREKNNIVRPDMINLLMQAKKGKLKHEQRTDEDEGFATAQESDIKNGESKQRELTDDDLVAQALIFFFAGFDTSSTLMSFMSLELAINPDVQQTLQTEIDDALRKSDENITYEAILKLKYLDQVVSESLRKWTPGFQTDRTCTKDYIIQPARDNEKPIHLKKGNVIIIPTCAIHYDPKYFPNPEKFDPDRFSDENKSSIVSGSYFPFGSGPRNCIGSRFALLEVKVFFFYVLSKFDIVVIEKTPVPIKISAKGGHTVDGGFWVGLKPREEKL